MSLEIERAASFLADLEMGSVLAAEPSPAGAAPALVLSSSMDKKKKKYVKQVTGRHNDTELHLAARRGDLPAVRRILGDVVAQVAGMTSEVTELEAVTAEMVSAVVNETNEFGETALITAAEKGHLSVVAELLQYSDKENISRKNRSGFDAFHVAVKEGHRGESLSSSALPLRPPFSSSLLLTRFTQTSCSYFSAMTQHSARRLAPRT